MANRKVHYEAAFEAFLRNQKIPYVATNEARRALSPEGSIKSLDFIVSPDANTSWLVDVKGRMFPSGNKQKQYWRNWSTREDIDSMIRWRKSFGHQFDGLLVFAFWVVGERSPLPPDDLFEHRGRIYGFVGVHIDDYNAVARTISPKWDTVAMSASDFRSSARSCSDIFARNPRMAIELATEPPLR